MPSAESGPDQKHALEAHWRKWVFPLPGIDRLVALHSSCPSQFRWSLAPEPSGRAQFRFPVRLAAGHDGPNHPCRFVGERSRCDLCRATCQQLHQPRPAGAMALGVSDDGHGAYEQQLTQIAVSLFCDSTEPFFAAAGVLARNKTNPRGRCLGIQRVNDNL